MPWRGERNVRGFKLQGGTGNESGGRSPSGAKAGGVVRAHSGNIHKRYTTYAPKHTRLVHNRMLIKALRVCYDTRHTTHDTRHTTHDTRHTGPPHRPAGPPVRHTTHGAAAGCGGLRRSGKRGQKGAKGPTGRRGRRGPEGAKANERSICITCCNTQTPCNPLIALMFHLYHLFGHFSTMVYRYTPLITLEYIF